MSTPETPPNSNPGQIAEREREVLARLSALIEEAVPLVAELTEIIPSDTDRRAAPMLGLAQSLAAARHFLAEYQEQKIATSRRLELLAVFVSITHALAAAAFQVSCAETKMIVAPAALKQKEYLATALHELRQAHRAVGGAMGKVRA